MSTVLLTGDCREVLRTLPDASVHCVVTSPPYWGLRDYGTATWEGGDPGCSHSPSKEWVASQINGSSGLDGGFDNQASSAARRWYVNGACRDCGAIRVDAQLGLEPDFNAYVANMVGVFREVRRVLRNDGTLFINLGDSYSAKQLVGIPWRVAFALQADGWYLRQDIIWSKPNPMPESVTDRCTKAHEYLFLLSKRERYYYDAEAIKEDRQGESHSRGIKRTPPIESAGIGHKDWCSYMTKDDELVSRNKRSVWEVTTQPFSEAHFATFPPALIEPCIKAGTSERCCSQCGKPWVRQVERSPAVVMSPASQYGNGAGRNDGNRSQLIGASATTLGWLPSCACAADAVPCTVLDPFAGAGTTGLVADRLQRNAVLIELNPTYAAMGERRIADDAPLFAEVRRPCNAP